MLRVQRVSVSAAPNGIVVCNQYLKFKEEQQFDLVLKQRLFLMTKNKQIGINSKYHGFLSSLIN
jgi:hypothetical protein